jgi:hypothetical protein
MANNLPISRLVNVDVVLAARAAQAQNLSTLLLLTSSSVIDVVERIRTYSSIDAVIDDFGTAGPEYAAANLWYQQSPQPAQIKFGRWAKTAPRGKLVGGAFPSSVAAFKAINNGGLTIGADAVAAVEINGLDFSTDANANAIAARVQAAIRAANVAFAGVSVVYNAAQFRYEVESGTTGAASKITFAGTPQNGTDLSGALKFTDATGAYLADGIAAESAVDAVALFDGQYGQTWYALVIPEAADADHLLVAALIESTNNKHVYGVTTQDSGTLTAASTEDVAYLLKQLGYNKTMVQFSSESEYAVCSLLGRALTVNYAGNNTVITLMYKDEPGIVAESMSESRMQALADRNCNVFVGYNNDTAIVEKGQVCSGEFIDTIVGADAFAVTVLNEVYNLLYTSPTKIPQTDAGTHLIVTTIESVCSQFVTNGFLAPGVWDQSGFGKLAQGDYLDKGFYVYAPAVSTQSKADRQARKSVPIQVAAKCAGAVHTVDVQLNISR